MRSIILAGLLLALGACSGTPVAARPDGYADVAGQVIQASGQPLGNTTVAISCSNGTVVQHVPADPQGHYAADLEVPGAAGEWVRCLLGAPDSVQSRMRADALIGFAPGGQLHPVQYVDLHEATP